MRETVLNVGDIEVVGALIGVLDRLALLGIGNGMLLVLLVARQAELVFDYACIPFDQVNDPSEQDGGALVEFGQVLNREIIS